jgi:hypothetical protein
LGNLLPQEVRAGKHAIMKRAHLPARDLRVLDPLLSYPSSILGREHAIVVNLEHIKTIITAQEVFLLDYQNPMVTPFVHDLKCRLPLNFNHQVINSSHIIDFSSLTSCLEFSSSVGLVSTFLYHWCLYNEDSTLLFDTIRVQKFDDSIRVHILSKNLHT